ncbi:MAG: hypothetical protein QOE70_5098 [Chthoniobacter sp.]|jgi:glycosyltransferase involved in cell wall biosynthesis|nr:hypothetical protein [Chthoniobacter sp.]
MPAADCPTKVNPFRVSVVICTYNPRAEAISKTLDGMRQQTLPLGEWELIIVDNASEPSVATRVDLSWHPAGRCVREEQRGLAWARLRGLREAAGGLVITVDDDNVLAPDYLTQALRIAQDWPMLGAWGGQITPIFEIEPPDWAIAYLHHLAIRPLTRSRWSSFITDHTMPYGAGLCVRREVVAGYQETAGRERILACFDRSANGAGDADDTYICYVAHELGFGVGVFPELRLQHLISRERFDPAYFTRISRGNSHAGMLLALRGNPRLRRFRSMAWPALRFMVASVIYRGMKRRICCAQARGEFFACLEYRRKFGALPDRPEVHDS